jgi:hypothetical protein
VVVQIGIALVFLDVAHRPTPHEVPLGLVGSAEGMQPIASSLETDGRCRITFYANAADAMDAIRRREIYGAYQPNGYGSTIYVASAAGTQPTTFVRLTFSQIAIQQLQADLGQMQGFALAQGQTSIPLTTIAPLANAAPATNDVVPLPPDDSFGASIPYIVQVLVMGGTIAATGLGQLLPRSGYSPKRGVQHALALLAYSLLSAAAMVWIGKLFNVGTTAAPTTLFWTEALVSLAAVASVSAAVTLIGLAGSLLGYLYFVIGAVISGASIAPEFFAPFWREFGQALPNGAAIYALRNVFYFHDAPFKNSLTTLGIYGVVGLLLVMIFNTLPHRSDTDAVVVEG